MKRPKNFSTIEGTRQCHTVSYIEIGSLFRVIFQQLSIFKLHMPFGKPSHKQDSFIQEYSLQYLTGSSIITIVLRLRDKRLRFREGAL